MSTSTNAILFYGYVWDDEDVELYDKSEGAWSEIVARRRGHTNPWDAYPEMLGGTYDERRAAGDAWVAKNHEAIDAWRDAKNAVEVEFGVVEFYHCSGECSMPALAAVRYTANRGSPLAVDVAMLVVNPEWNDMLDRWLTEMGVEKPHENPGWYLVSFWG